MLFYDIESLGVNSDSVLLSAALVYVDPKENKTYDEVIKDVCFVKFDVMEQLVKYKRKIDQGTIEWWEKQSLHARKISIIPNKELDVSAEVGLATLKQYAKQYKSGTTVWARGGMDQSITEHLFKQINVAPFAYFNSFRDLRTAIDIFYNGSSGYSVVSSEAPGFDKSKVIKHDPCHDIVYDAFQLYHGVAKE